MPSAVKLSSKYQISIPKEVREAANWRAGQKLTFIPRDGGFMIVRVPEREELFGIAKGADTSHYRDRNDRT